MDRPTFFGKVTTRLLIVITLVAIASPIQIVLLGGHWFASTTTAYIVSFFWIVHVRDFNAERKWFDGGMTGERPKQRSTVRSLLFTLAMFVSILAYFTWFGFRYDEW